MMKKLSAAIVAGAIALSATSCDNYLDVNTNPNAPEQVAANLYLPPMVHWMVTSPQFDGRFVGHYTQEWFSISTSTSPALTWGRMGYDPGSDNGAQQWRDVYWSLGQNLVDMNRKAQDEQRWDLLGVGQILKAWGWLVTTDLHGEIIVKEAIDPSKFYFNYDTQDYAYQEIKRLLDSAIVLLQRTDGAVDASFLARGDKVYGGDRTKWLKVAYGMRALWGNHYSNKASYNPAQVIADVDASFASNADDFLLTYPGTSPGNEDANFWGRKRDNATNYRQTTFMVNLMNGTAFGGTVDPRMTRMLSPAPDGQYRGVDINTLGGGLTTALMPNNPFGYAGTGGLNLPGRYIFDDKAKIPFMTYSQLQFVKAEAALRSGNSALALTAYTNGISSHIDFVNSRNLDNGQTPTQITAAEKTAFLGSANIVPAAGSLTLSHIMSQKVIAQFGWGHNELWMDMRRYHYTDLDPVSGIKVFRGFTPPTTLYGDNGGQLVYRIRPRYNSEYVWNRDALNVIGGLATNYHTVPTWIITP
jgi:hypothetical protein